MLTDNVNPVSQPETGEGTAKPWQFKKGICPNPGGMPKRKTAKELGAAWRELVAIGRRIRVKHKLEVLDAAIATWQRTIVEGNSSDRLKAATQACETLGLSIAPVGQVQHTHSFSPETEARIAARLAAELRGGSALPALPAPTIQAESVSAPGEAGEIAPNCIGKHSFCPHPPTDPAPRPRKQKLVPSATLVEAP